MMNSATTIHHAIDEGFESTLNGLMEYFDIKTGDTTPEQEAIIDKCIDELSTVVTDILMQNRKPMTVSRALEILIKYMESDDYTESLYILRDSCGCTDLELEEIGFDLDDY